MIKMEKINKIYNQGKSSQVHALKDVDFNVNAGDMVAISGPSGSGKSTLLHILAGIDRQTDGSYLFDGKDISKMSDRQKSRLRNREIGIVMQDFGLLDGETVIRNVCLPQIIGNTYNREVKAGAKEMLSLVGMEKYLDKKVNQLSGGQKQRVTIGVAIVKDIPAIYFDEPTSGLDYDSMVRVSKLIEQLSDSGVIVFVVSHDFEFIVRTCTEVVQLDDDGTIQNQQLSPTVLKSLSEKYFT